MIKNDTTLQIETPEWAEPLLQPSRYKGAHGGRGSGKSHFFAELLIEEHVRDQNQCSVCIREVQRSLSQSVKKLLENKIKDLGVGHYFNIQESVIKSVHGEGLIIFQGMQNHTAESIKSLEGYHRAWIEEAQSLSQRSLDLLRPTIRTEKEEDGIKEKSELWFTWNPYAAKDPVDVLLRGEVLPQDAIVLEVNFEDNPFFPDTLKEEMEYDRSRDIDKYNHVWLGEYIKNSEARIFKNWTIKDFEAPADVTFRYGADWGFAQDPTVLTRCYIEGRKLYIDYEAVKIECEIPDTPRLFYHVPDSEKWRIIADSARPEMISYMKKHGFPHMKASKKGKGSIEEGIEWLKSYDIIVHPRCKETINELTHYSYKIDPHTEEILPIIKDDNNHIMDALRYACESIRRAAPQLTALTARK